MLELHYQVHDYDYYDYVSESSTSAAVSFKSETSQLDGDRASHDGHTSDDLRTSSGQTVSVVILPLIWHTCYSVSVSLQVTICFLCHCVSYMSLCVTICHSVSLCVSVCYYVYVCLCVSTGNLCYSVSLCICVCQYITVCLCMSLCVTMCHCLCHLSGEVKQRVAGRSSSYCVG